jgi:hypothetical protein
MISGDSPRLFTFALIWLRSLVVIVTTSVLLRAAGPKTSNRICSCAQSANLPHPHVFRGLACGIAAPMLDPLTQGRGWI